MAEIHQLILDELREIRTDQKEIRTDIKYQGGQLSHINVRLSVVESQLTGLTKRVDSMNGCARELATEVDELSCFAEKVQGSRWSRTDKLKIAGLSLTSIFSLAALIISIVC